MRRALEVLLVLFLISGHAAIGTPVRIRINLAGSPLPEAPIQGVLRIVPQAGSGTAAKQEIPIEAPGELEIDLRPGITWEARFEAKGFWGEALAVLPQQQQDGFEARLRVFPAGTVRGRIVLPVGEKKLPALAVRFQSPWSPRENERLEATVSCPVAEGTITCEVPAGRLDLRLRGEGGFAPIYLWGVEVPAGKSADLGDLTLRRGASVSGWVQTSEGNPPAAECRLRLTPDSAYTDDLRVRDRIEKAALEARPNEKGFFQILGVPPGRYELTADLAGYAPARTGPIDVRPELESQVIERLVLAKPVPLEVVLNPPVEPYGKPWRISLERRNESSEVPSDQYGGAASAEGLWRSSGIPPGTYELTVQGDLNTFWHREFLEIRPGQPAVRIDLPVLWVKGTIEMGKEPLAATLWLTKEGGRRLRFDSDERGRFSGVLPGEGLWSPKVESEAADVHAQLDPIEIELPSGKSTAEIEIVVPNNHLTGRVEDEAGKPVPAAEVLVIGTGRKMRQSRLQTDEKGEFSARGLSPGGVLLKAFEGERQSDFAAASMPEEGEGPWLRIVLRRVKTFEGRVVSPTGGVPGVLVQAWTALDAQGAATTAQGVSSPDGRFHLELPAGTAILSFAVLPPGFAMRLLTLPVIPGQGIEIPVESQGGTLILELGAADRPTPLLVRGGTFMIARELRSWARMQGAPSDPARLVLPNVEAGPWSLCAGGGVVSRLQEGAEPPAAACASGVLVPNGELILQVPVAGATR